MSTTDAAAPTASKFPINRVVAFAGPYVAILSGTLADWLLVHVHLLDLFHTTSTQVAGAITQLVVFALTAILVWLGQHKWLDGWQKWEGVIETAIAGEHVNGPDLLPEDLAARGDYDPETAGEDSEPVVAATAVSVAEPEPVVVEADDEAVEPPPPASPSPPTPRQQRRQRRPTDPQA